MNELPPIKRAVLDSETAGLLSQFFGALSDPTRIAIIALLVENTRTGAELHQRGLNPSEIAALVGMSQSAVSHHLRGLRQMQLVHTHRMGREIIYFLRDDCIAQILEVGLSHLAERWSERRPLYP